jgi:aspartyl-tRNA(Asn)/glutamyl-tRNA(Gln) amidotransferase subunit C
MMKVKIDAELILKVAKNARLNLSEKEAREFVPQLQDVLDSFSKLDKLDVASSKPSFQPIELENVMREDKKGSCLSQEEALSNTQHKKDGYFKGPKIV